MRTTFQVVDNFLNDPYAVRARASSMDFSVAPEYMGHRYPGIIPLEHDDPLRSEMVEKISGLHGREVNVSLAFLRLSLQDEDTPVWIHPDSCVDEWAGVLYLSRADFCSGGTAFWRHRGLGWESLPSTEKARESGVVMDQSFVDRLNSDGNDIDKWTITGLLPMAYNRFITYPSKLFHSRYPRQSFGDCFDNGRLIAACFYS
jgi:hypothetical protein